MSEKEDECIGVDPSVETEKMGTVYGFAADDCTAAGLREKLLKTGKADMGSAGEQPMKE
jgi:hypothetical protein